MFFLKKSVFFAKHFFTGNACKIEPEAPNPIFSEHPIMSVIADKRKFDKTGGEEHEAEAQAQDPPKAKVPKHQGCDIDDFMGEFIDRTTIEHDVDVAPEEADEVEDADETEGPEETDAADEADEAEIPLTVAAGCRASEVPDEIWKKIVETVVGLFKEQAGNKPVVRDIMRILSVNKLLTGMVREALVVLGRIRCKVVEIPRAVVVSETISELCVVGSAQLPESEAPQVPAQVVEEARESLAREGQRFKSLCRTKRTGLGCRGFRRTAPKWSTQRCASVGRKSRSAVWSRASRMQRSGIL